MLISLVGLSGSGKTTIANYLCAYNNKIIHLDIDKIAHKVLNIPEVKEKIINYFGQKIIKDNQINRTELSKIVFNDLAKKEFLSKLTWSYMEQIIDEFIKVNSSKIIILDYLLLPLTKYFKMSDLRILVTASQSIRFQRLIKRDKLTIEQCHLREKNAPILNQEEYEYIINNDEVAKAKEKVGEIYAKSIIHR